MVEFGAQYVWPVGDFVIGGSASYIAGTSDPLTGREDIDSWSAGLEVRRGRFTAGAAYVDRGQSNLLATAPDESEWNAGVSWRDERWAVAGSVAIGDESGGTVSRYGLGGEFDITQNVYVAADAVVLEAEDAFGLVRDGAVGLVEIGVRF